MKALATVAALTWGTCHATPAPAPPPTTVPRADRQIQSVTTFPPTTHVHPPSVPGGPAGEGVWARLAVCESGMRNLHGPRYYGFHSWLVSTWHAAGGTGRPDEHSYEQQVAVAKSWLARTSWRQWPACSRRLGLA